MKLRPYFQDSKIWSSEKGNQGQETGQTSAGGHPWPKATSSCTNCEKTLESNDTKSAHEVCLPQATHDSIQETKEPEGCTGEGKGATPPQTEPNQSKAWNAQMQFMEMLYLSFCEATERN